MSIIDMLLRGRAEKVPKSCLRLSRNSRSRRTTGIAFTNTRKLNEPRNCQCYVAEEATEPFPLRPPKSFDEDGNVIEEESEEKTYEILHDLSAAPYQQTINRSFTIGGLGLHTGEQVIVRVRPAYAGDGRYFVRVPVGTNEERAYEGNIGNQEEIQEARAADPYMDHKQTAAFMQYCKAQADQGYPGTFEEYILDSGLDVSVAGLQAVEFDDSQYMQEPVVRKPTDGSALDASFRNFAGRTPFCQLLGSQDPNFADLQMAGAETLLAVMEGLHIDNARIEFEGAAEMPILDGSGQVWVEKFAWVGLRPAYKEGSDLLERKHSWRPNSPISVFDHDSFITLYPAGLFKRITAGIEPADCPVIGSQWISFEHQAATNPVRSFAIDFAPARTWISSVDMVYAMTDAGYLKAGTPDCCLVADGDDWRDTVDIRFQNDEPARHAVMDLMGDLALLGENGNSGIPTGHIVAFNADHALVMDFIIHVAEAIEANEVQEFPFMMLPSEMDYIKQLQMEMVDEVMERGGIDAKDPVVGEERAEGEEHLPPITQEARAKVRRELDIVREGLEQRLQILEDEQKEKDERIAAEAKQRREAEKRAQEAEFRNQREAEAEAAWEEKRIREGKPREDDDSDEDVFGFKV